MKDLVEKNDEDLAVGDRKGQKKITDRRLTASVSLTCVE
jgi:hypothetical protein